MCVAGRVHYVAKLSDLVGEPNAWLTVIAVFTSMANMIVGMVVLSMTTVSVVRLYWVTWRLLDTALRCSYDAKVAGPSWVLHPWSAGFSPPPQLVR